MMPMCAGHPGLRLQDEGKSWMPTFVGMTRGDRRPWVNLFGGWYKWRIAGYLNPWERDGRSLQRWTLAIEAGAFPTMANPCSMAAQRSGGTSP